MDLRNVPVSPASEAPPEVVAAFMRFVQQNPNLFMGKQVELNALKPAPQHMVFRCPHCDAPVLSGLEECPQCKQRITFTLKAGDVVHDRYEVEDLMVKQGGFGHLYAVRDRQAPGFALAMKQLQHRRVTDKDRELFEREGRLLRMLGHRGLPRFHDAFTEQGAMYLVMERIPGMTIANFMRQHGVFTEAQLFDWLPQMLEVLSYLHHHDPVILHRDVKPANFMITPEGRLYLIDFGAAGEGGRDREREANGLPADLTAVSTRGFSAPEVLLGGEAGPASDLFSLGTTLLYMLTARHPFVFYDPASASYRLEELPVSEGLRAVLARLLAVPARERYADAEEVLAELVERQFIRPNPDFPARG